MRSIRAASMRMKTRPDCALRPGTLTRLASRTQLSRKAGRWVALINYWWSQVLTALRALNFNKRNLPRIEPLTLRVGLEREENRRVRYQENTAGNPRERTARK